MYVCMYAVMTPDYALYLPPAPESRIRHPPMVPLESKSVAPAVASQRLAAAPPPAAADGSTEPSRPAHQPRGEREASLRGCSERGEREERGGPQRTWLGEVGDDADGGRDPRHARVDGRHRHRRPAPPPAGDARARARDDEDGGGGGPARRKRRRRRCGCGCG
jgi:hypothetical protein